MERSDSEGVTFAADRSLCALTHTGPTTCNVGLFNLYYKTIKRILFKLEYFATRILIKFIIIYRFIVVTDLVCKRYGNVIP